MRRAPLFFAACAAMFIFGVVLAILGALFGLPEMRMRLGIDLAQQGDIFLALFFGVFVSTVIAGPAIDRFGNKPVLIISAALVVAALALFSFAHALAPAIAAVFVLGFGGGGLNTSANALVADVYAENRGTMLNVLGVFFGAGALMVPLLVGFCSVTQVLAIAAAIAALCAIAAVRVPALRPAQAGWRAGLHTPGLYLFALLLFFESGNEASIGGWTSTYAGSIGVDPRVATWVLAAYWAALMAGRLLGARLLRTFTPARLVLASGIGSAIGSAILLASKSIALMAAGAVIDGLSFAAIYPTVLAMAADRGRLKSAAPQLFGLLLAAGLIGGMLFPFGIGHISQHYGMRAGMALPLIASIAISGLIARSSHGNSGGGTRRFVACSKA